MRKAKQIKSLYVIYITIIATILTLIIVNNSVFADTVDYSVTVEPVLNITTSGDTDGVVTLDLNPETKAFDSKNLTVTVGTNNETGYKLYVNTTSSNTNLVEKNDSNLYIQTLASEVSEENFTPNRWGYKLNSSNTNYIPFVSGALVNSSNTATAGNSSTLTFGAKASYDTKAGSYVLALNFQATANPLIRTIADANYLQDVSSKEIGGCPSDLPPNQTYTLKDSRDEQEYQVARLADGNCWMITNLNLGAVTLTNDLTSENTNLSSTISASAFNSWKKTSGSGDYTSPEYIVQTGADSYNNLPYGTLYNYCATSAETICSDSNPSDDVYNLCPAGWRLPTGGPGGEFQTLYGNSNYNNSTKMRNLVSDGGAAFVRAGYFRPTIYYLGTSGCYWSSTRYNNSIMYRFYVDVSSVNAVDNVGTNGGRSIRCILK